VVVKRILGILILAATVFAQSAIMNREDTLKNATRAIQLMESAGVALPDLARAGMPASEIAKNALAKMRLRADHVSYNFEFVNALRTFVLVSDAVPKPFPFPEESRKQLAELRDLQTRFETHFRALIERREQQVRTPDLFNLDRYADANTRVGPPDAAKPRIVFFGDSITDGWRLNEYFPDRDFVNRGISGQTTSQMLGRVKPDIVALKPVAVLILAGTNDLARGTPVNRIVENYSAITDLLNQYNIKVIYASVLPVSDHHKDRDPSYERSLERPNASIRALNDWLQKYCNGRNCTYLDYFSKLVDPSGQLKAELADDGLHPNAAGYRVMAPLALEAIDRIAPVVQPKPKKKRLFGSEDGKNPDRSEGSKNESSKSADAAKPQPATTAKPKSAN
jgi:lysophospholipase L1-like esterase